MRLSPELEAKQAQLDFEREEKRKKEEAKTIRAMRERGEPVRSDFTNRAAYRRALSRYRRK